MAESFVIPEDTDKKGKYESLLPQLFALTDGETDGIANCANLIAALKETFSFFWIGIYFVKRSGSGGELVLGPFQGPVACTRIQKGKGVCGTAWDRREAIIVEDVNKFPGHIACSALSKSEIVIPVFKEGDVIAVIDVDSDKENDFDATDLFYLTAVAELLSIVI